VRELIFEKKESCCLRHLFFATVFRLKWQKTNFVPFENRPLQNEKKSWEACRQGDQTIWPQKVARNESQPIFCQI
jgi:hypothetical protein